MEKVFKKGDSVKHYHKGTNKILIGKVIDDNYNPYKNKEIDSCVFPIRVEFINYSTPLTFTADGRFLEDEEPTLTKTEPMFNKGDDVVFLESEGTYLHGVVCYVDEDGRSFPIEVELNGFGRQKLSFTADGRYRSTDDQKLFLTKDCKVFKMKEASKKVSEFKESLILSEPKIIIDENRSLDEEKVWTHTISSKDLVKNEYDHVSAPHYRKSPIEAIEIFENLYGTEKTALWCEITALKYRLRLGHKPTSPIEDDLKKEKWYLEKREELLKKIPKSVGFECNECKGNSPTSDQCENPSCPNQPCCGKPKELCSCI